jgi:hypothetical protein
MKNRTLVILFALTALLLFASALQQATGLFRFKALNGVTKEVPKPQANLASFLDVSLQDSTEAYLRQNYGFREPLTRLHNQTRWSLFRYAQVEEDGRIAVTPDNWIFEPRTVEEYYQGLAYYHGYDSATMTQAFEAEAQRLHQIQELLEPYGTHLFVALLPGKEQICTEYLPENTCYHEEKKITAYDFYSKRLKELGINCIDFANLFMQMKDTTSYPLFPQTGTHWSVLAAQHSADSLVRYMEDLAGINMMNIRLDPDYQHTVLADKDLESLMNLIWPIKKRPNRITRTHTDGDTTAVHPTLITIGDSFYWNILNQTPFAVVFEKVPYWFYFSTAYYNNDNPSVTQDVNDIDVLQEVIDADFVMLSYSTVSLYQMSHGFSERLLDELIQKQNEQPVRLPQCDSPTTEQLITDN